MTEGIIFNIQRFSIHDGPGIRTTVFLKGCPLDCLWCHNPESKDQGKQVILWQDRCIGCGACIKACPEGYLSPGNGGPVAGGKGCKACGRCAEVCPAAAREVVGRIVTAEEVVSEAERDTVFYDQSGGGVTFSGGEPLAQPQFLGELLDCCRKKGIHTAVDTCGYAPWRVIESIMSKVDLFLYDIKLMDECAHRKYCGVSNGIILDNLKLLARNHGKVIVRIPVIPGVNDDGYNINKTGEFVCSAGIKEVSLLPYHSLGIEKQRRLGIGEGIFRTSPPPRERLDSIKAHLEKFGLNVRIGG